MSNNPEIQEEEIPYIEPVNAFIVVLKEDAYDEDVEDISNALQMVKGVLEVSPLPADVPSHIGYTRAKEALRERVFKCFYE